MRYFFYSTIFFLSVSCHSKSSTEPNKGYKTYNSTIKLKGVEKNAPVYIAVYDSKENFPDKKNAAIKSLKITEVEKKEHSIKKLPAKVAVAAFIDENNNGKLDKNALGVPVEPYTFSGSGKSLMPPSFDEALVSAKKPIVLEF